MQLRKKSLIALNVIFAYLQFYSQETGKYRFKIFMIQMIEARIQVNCLIFQEIFSSKSLSLQSLIPVSVQRSYDCSSQFCDNRL